MESAASTRPEADRIANAADASNVGVTSGGDAPVSASDSFKHGILYGLHHKEKNSALTARQMRVWMRELNFLHMALQNLSTQASLVAAFTVAELMYGAPHYLESDVK